MDTALILRALPFRIRIRTAPAAAEDYFFSTRSRSGFFQLLVGAFPFPRRGPAGLDRARALLDSGWSVILFPEGTRSRDGSVGGFRCGAAILAAEGWRVVPIGIAGARSVLPKGRRWPRRAPVSVTVGGPMRVGRDPDPGRIATRMRQEVVDLGTGIPEPRAGARALFDRVGSYARTRGALGVAFLWGFCEALFFPIIPDFALAPVALAAPGRAAVLAVAIAAGSVAGGFVAYVVGASTLVPVAHLPLVTERMAAQAAAWMHDLGGAGLMKQPLSGIPFKAFGYQAHAEGVPLVAFLAFSAAARGARLVAVAGLFGAGGAVLGNLWRRVSVPFLIVYAIAFAAGLTASIRAWS